MSHATLLILAKAPVPGRSKTRLIPAFGAAGAAELAAAALQDTLAAAAATAVERRVLVLDGNLADCPYPIEVPGSVEILAQVHGDHATRIAAALAACHGPALLIGMDTPQVCPAVLESAFTALRVGALRVGAVRVGELGVGELGVGAPRVDVAGPGAPGSGDGACLGPARDGGWWALGLADPARYAWAALAGVPMSTDRTGGAQRLRLVALGLTVTDLPELRDVDEAADAFEVARAAAGSRFAATLARLAVQVG